MAAPTECPTCGTAVPAGANRCIACGKVFGEDNRCPHCHALAGVVVRSGGFACAACGGAREKKPGTVVLGGGGAGGGRGAPMNVAVRRGASVGLRTFGALGIGTGVVLAALAAMIVPGAAGLVIALILGGAAVGGGAAMLRAGSKHSTEADRQERTRHERSVFELAEQSDGDLTVTETARALGVPVAEADRLLTDMADGSRVTVEVDPDGVVHYVFRELRRAAPAAARVRVDDVGFREPVEEEGAAEAERPDAARRSREL